VAERVLAANAAGDRVRLVEGDAREVEIEEPIDVIVNELIGDFGTDENIYECVAGFARRHLNPAGRILPERLRTCLVPVEYGAEYRGVWREDFYGLDLRPAIDFPCRAEAVMHGLRQRPKELAAPLVVEDVIFGPAMAEQRHRIDLSLEVTARGRLQGFVGYFGASLAEGIRLGNYPCYETCHRANWNWPVSPPVEVVPGQRITATLNARLNMIAPGWTMEWSLD